MVGATLAAAGAVCPDAPWQSSAAETAAMPPNVLYGKRYRMTFTI
jgi:hypothetical protein